MSKFLVKSMNLRYETLPNAQYHERPDLGASTLKSLDRDGAELCAMRSAFSEGESRDLIVGSAVHTFFEDGGLDRYIEAPDSRGYKTPDSESFQKAQLEAMESGKILLTRAEYATVNVCGEALKRKLGAFLFGRQRWIEPSIFWDQAIPAAGFVVACKCRPDALVDNGDGTPIYFEIKTALDNSPRGWKSACWRYGYWLQQAHYEAGIRAATGCGYVRTIFVVVRKANPVTVRLYEFNSLTAAAAVARWETLVADYARRRSTNDWQDEVGLNPTEIDLGMTVQDDLEQVT